MRPRPGELDELWLLCRPRASKPTWTLMAVTLLRKASSGIGAGFVRVRITQSVVGRIDGIRLEQFEPGRVYNVVATLGCYLISVGSATLELEPGAPPALPDQGIDRLDQPPDRKAAEPRAEAAERSPRPRRRDRRRSPR
jgi:hypothetical protein